MTLPMTSEVEERQQRPEEIERYLEQRCISFFDRPYDFAAWCWPWDEPKGPLEGESLEGWQETILRLIQQGLTTGTITHNNREYDCATGVYIAVRSGHGIGKSALMGMLTHWFHSTHIYARSITTANTANQLEKKTWTELAKWHQWSINSHWFRHSATAYRMIKEGEDTAKRWFAEAVPWSTQRAQAFAGAHVDVGGIMLQFDEASEVENIIWETAEGALSDAKGHRIWIVFGNPTKNTGRFYECFHKFRHRWVNMEIDARTVRRTDKAKIQNMLEDWGEDSDYFRVRVRGKEPKAGLDQFIGTDLVERSAALALHPAAYHDMPKVMGVDVAWWGTDSNVVCKRQGGKVYNLKKHRPPSWGDLAWLNTFADIVAHEINEWEPDAVFVDVTGIGAGLYSNLNALGFEGLIIPVQGAEAAQNPKEYYNKRAEMYGLLKKWMSEGGSIPDDQELKDDLIKIQYGFRKGAILLESKDDMRARGEASPDCGDAVSMTFAAPVNKQSGVQHKRQRRARCDYDIFAETADDYQPY